MVAHPNGGVKEQVAGLYAQLLAQQGYITIAADAAYQGASGGEPLLMISGEKSDTHYMTQAVFDNATGTSDKELFIVKGATHIETYWKPEYVKQIADKLTDFFGKNLDR